MTDQPKTLAQYATEIDSLASHRNQPAAPPGWDVAGSWSFTDDEGSYTGMMTSAAVDPDEAQILAEMGLDPENWQVMPGSLQVRKWQMPTGKALEDGSRELVWCWYYRIRVERRYSSVNIDEFVAHIRNNRSRKAPVSAGIGQAQLWCTSDHQVGKAGTTEAVDRMLELPFRFRRSWKASGRPEHIVVVFGGDHGEACQHHYPNQPYEIELHERDQRRVFREIAHNIIDRAAGLAPKVTVLVVGGNHGEVRSAKRALATSVGDNRDVAMIEDVRWAYRDHDRWSHVEWLIPGDDLTVCAEFADVRVAVAHGHQIPGGAQNIAANVRKWWDAQAGNHRPAGAAQLLLTGHYHHFQHVWYGPRTWIQMPSEDNGSPGFAERYGTGGARPGSVTVDLADGNIGDVRIV